MLKLLEQQILDTKEQIKKEKSTYSWSLYSCADDKCKDNVVKKFLKHLFNYEEKKMKLTTARLKKLIREEMQRLNELVGFVKKEKNLIITVKTYMYYS